MTPGQRMAHAHFLRNMAATKRHDAASPGVMPFWRKRWLDDADRMDGDAQWFEESASRVPRLTIERFQEAAE